MIPNRRYTYAIYDPVQSRIPCAYVSSTKGADGTLMDYLYKFWTLLEDVYGPYTDCKARQEIKDIGLYAVGLDIINLE